VCVCVCVCVCVYIIFLIFLRRKLWTCVYIRLPLSVSEESRFVKITECVSHPSGKISTPSHRVRDVCFRNIRARLAKGCTKCVVPVFCTREHGNNNTAIYDYYWYYYKIIDQRHEVIVTIVYRIFRSTVLTVAKNKNCSQFLIEIIRYIITHGCTRQRWLFEGNVITIVFLFSSEKLFIAAWRKRLVSSNILYLLLLSSAVRIVVNLFYNVPNGFRSHIVLYVRSNIVSLTWHESFDPSR
jgi:hypothetical protein